MNHTAARRYAVGSGIAALASACVVAAVATATDGLGWALAGWSVTALTGVIGGSWMTARVGSPDTGVLVAFGATLLARLVVSTGGAAVASAAGDAAFWPFLGGLVAGFVPVQAFEIGWFYRMGRQAS